MQKSCSAMKYKKINFTHLLLFNDIVKDRGVWAIKIMYCRNLYVSSYIFSSAFHEIIVENLELLV